MRFSLACVAALASAVMAAPQLPPLPDCNSPTCQALINETTCILDAGNNPFRILACVIAAGGISKACPCIKCLPAPLPTILDLVC